MGLKIRITQLDGKLPNLALMRLGAWHHSQGDDVRWERGVQRHFDEPDYDVVYGSAIFADTAKAVGIFRQQFPGAIVGGTGGDRLLRVEHIVPSQFTDLDYSGYPDFIASIGYAMRGCRFKCGFCIVPKMEGRARAEGSIHQIWRGGSLPKHIHLLDNDFFGNPVWRDRVAEIERDQFRVCINQGINVRLLDDEQADAICRIIPYDDQFKRRRLYTAWDNIGDERVFFDGVERLDRAGWKPEWTFVYMLVGYDPRETWDRLFHRYSRMMERGLRPYPMVHDRFRSTKPDHWRKLKRFQRWVVTGANKVAPFEEYSTKRSREKLPDLFERTA